MGIAPQSYFFTILWEVSPKESKKKGAQQVFPTTGTLPFENATSSGFGIRVMVAS